ncbi:HNH endonuclease [Cellulomonas hominis]|uniref:HNH endonuclease n=1 Tax=Cellulomonas hominis TaxID=156981 RepID=A0A511FHL4_9CELL|nr:HNH endonuclease [Cellulomonas hominis]MBB5474840.1 hypothetical protein [Cellulomonas hominis]NKY05634.1 HNH endonuclease [Cellulomonas hominis]GEL48064.1 HNH endonuclease [Cellulomonas hominis]
MAAAPGVLVLNAGLEPLHRVDFKHAIRMLVREVAVVHEAAAGSFGPYPRPLVVRLVRYVQMGWAYARTGYGPVSKAGIKRRDKVCAYCGGPPETIDHVHPKSRGGASSWLNQVAACRPCNGAKADRTPQEAGMPLLYATPYDPTARTR